MDEHDREMTRRVLIRGAALTGVALPMLAACGSDTGPSGSGGAPRSAETSGSPGGETPDGAGGTTVATSDVPVGGGTILAEQKVVVTQPAAGEFKAFSAVCTHQGCTVQTVEDGKIGCPCHGSAFSVEDGSVVTGPATRPLETRSVRVEGGEVTVS